MVMDIFASQGENIFQKHFFEENGIFWFIFAQKHFEKTFVFKSCPTVWEFEDGEKNMFF